MVPSELDGLAKPAIERPRSLADLAWVELRRAILQGELQPGEPLPLKTQAERLGMSIMPVREAIRRLAHEGLVEQQPQRGAVVAPVSVAALEDMYSIRIALESLAVRRAAENMTERDYRRLTDILDEFVAAYRRGDVAQSRELHRSFHLGLYRLAGSQWLDRLVPPLLDNSERYRGLSIPLRGSPEERRAEHQAILEACRRRDGELAARLLAAHLERTVELVKRGLLERGHETEVSK